METEYEIIKLEVHEYISPECSCKIEDMVNAVVHVIESIFDPVNNILAVKAHRGMVTAKETVNELKKCKIRCDECKPLHEMAHMEHEGMKKGMSPAHDPHAMMEAEMKRHFIVAAIFTIPVLILSRQFRCGSTILCRHHQLEIVCSLFQHPS
ncbi:MAG: Copper/silver-translocating P-type ATPase [Thermoproteota archaeon]|nr:Copper/silver-translocating P-type ATPase [Thermoproteota archaeon]